MAIKDDLVAATKEWVEDVAKSWTEPDDDLRMSQITALTDADEIALLPLVGLRPEQELAAVRTAIVTFAPRCITLTQSVWAVAGKRGEARPTGPLEEDPRRTEQIQITYADPETYELYWAELMRRENEAPVLGPWIGLDAQDFETIAGRFPHVIAAAFTTVMANRN